MRQIKAIVATGHLDKQGEMLAPEALYGMAEQANKAYIPMWVEHDIAQAPIGRMTHAEVVQMDDGVLAVQSTGEVWESSADIANIKSDGRKMVIHEVDVATFEVGFDLTFHDPEGQNIIHDLQEFGKARSQYEGRKSALVVSQLVIAAGAFTVGAIFGGFFKALGEDLYNGLKERLKAIRKKTDAKGEERASRILFRFTVESEGRKVEVNTVIDNATDHLLDKFFSEGIKALDPITTKALKWKPRVARITTRQTVDDLELLYLVRDDCAPFSIERTDETT
jgi:hypothetical protein